MRYLLILAGFFIFSCSTQHEAPKIMTRAEWGSKPIPDSLVYHTHTINKITIHHGGEDFPADKNVIQYLKNLQSWSRREKKWADIPYHYLIAPDGSIYVGRPDSIAGDTNTTYDPTGHLLICALGNFEEIEIPDVQYQSLIKLTAYFAQKYKITPDQIETHKDYAETACPGKNLYRYFEDGSFLKKLDL